MLTQLNNSIIHTKTILTGLKYLAGKFKRTLYSLSFCKMCTIWLYVFVVLKYPIILTQSAAEPIGKGTGFRMRIFFADPDPGKNLHVDPVPDPGFFLSFFHVSDDSLQRMLKV